MGKLPYFYIAALLTELFCVIKIIASDDNPDYKVPWLLCVLVVPIAGFMLYFLWLRGGYVACDALRRGDGQS